MTANAGVWRDGHAAVRVFALRHGRTAWNAGQRLQGQLDVALDATGHWQAARLARALADESIDAVYCSDLRRAADTAAPLAASRGLVAQREPGLRERGFGFLEGHTFDEIETRWPDAARHWRQRAVDAAPGGGESLTAFSQRCLRTAATLAARHPGGAVALVAHGGVLDCLYRAATGAALDAPRSWGLGNAVVNRLLWTPQGFTLVGWDDARHLDDTDAPA